MLPGSHDGWSPLCSVFSGAKPSKSKSPVQLVSKTPVWAPLSKHKRTPSLWGGSEKPVWTWAKLDSLKSVLRIWSSVNCERQLGGRLYSTNQTQMFLSYPSVTPIYSKATENIRIKLLKLAQVFVSNGLFYKQTKNLGVGGRINR